MKSLNILRLLFVGFVAVCAAALTAGLAACGKTDDQPTAPATVFVLGVDDSSPEGAVFLLSGSQAGVSYTLLRDGSPVGSEAPGTGEAISFAGNFNAEGVYTACSVANNDYRQTDMSGRFTVQRVEKPATVYYTTEPVGQVKAALYRTEFNDKQPDVKVSDLSTSLQCMEEIDGTVYGITFDKEAEKNDLVTIDLATGAMTTIAANIEADGIGMTHNPVDGKVYVSTFRYHFGTIDLTTGAFTKIKTGQPKYTIAIDSDGAGYAQTIVDGGLGQAQFGFLNLYNGGFTPIMLRSGTIEYAQTIKFDKATGRLYWMKRVALTERTDTQFVEIDKNTGATTPVEIIKRFVQSFVMINNSGYRVL